MDPSFSLKGIELGKLVLSSGLLESSWSKISEMQNQDTAPRYKIHKEAKFTFVVFTAPPSRRNGSLDSDSTPLCGSQKLNPFPSLCSEKITSFSVHTPAFELFTSAQKDLSNLKTELLKSKKPVIITGAALGGSVASLFTLWLLEAAEPENKETVEPGKKETVEPSDQKTKEKKKPEQKRPLCITFGSPLIGDASLQQLLENSVRNSCFLHVADAAMTPITKEFKPFGTFLICDGSGCVCIEDTEAVTELLNDANTDLVGYSKVGQHRLDPSVLSMADSILNIPGDVIARMEERAWKKLSYDQSKRLKNMKISMAYIEEYKKKSKEVENGYYDQYRFKIQSEVSINVQGWKKELNHYWISLVEEVEKKPQSDIEILSRRFLFAGNNYRRMIEPLDIAEYYLNGGKEYRTSGRSSHYVMLDKWFEKYSKKQEKKPDRDEKRDLSHLLTFDSCFWAEVEEAMIVIDQLKAVEGMIDEILMGKLVKFEEYVSRLIGERAVSPEIFLEKSSFMSWWKEYEKIKVNSLPFTEFMNSESYKSYGNIAA